MSTTYNDSGFKTFIADAAIGLYDRVKLDSDGRITQAGITDNEVGIAHNAAFAAGDEVNVRLRTAPGTHIGRAKEAHAAGATLYTEAAGEFQDTAAATAFPVAKAITAAVAENDLFEFIYLSLPVAAS